MNAETRALAERLAAHPGWRWAPGMLLHPTGSETSLRVAEVLPDGRLRLAWPHRLASNPEIAARDYTLAGIGRATPDLDDPATGGCLLALHAADVGPAELFLNSEGAHLKSWGRGNGRIYKARSLGAACAAALLAVWGEP